MRWPNRHPHTLTHGMRQAQKSLAGFTNFINWKRFRRRNLNSEVETSTDKVAVYACADAEQAVVWVLRKDTILKRAGMLDKNAAPVEVALKVPGMEAGAYRFTMWDTANGKAILQEEAQNTVAGSVSVVIPAVQTDVALAIQKIR